MPLSLERDLVPVQEDARVEVLSLNQALERVGIVAVTRVEFSVSHHQVVLERDEEARRSGIALTAGASWRGGAKEARWGRAETGPILLNFHMPDMAASRS
jgi:hypothetical protein